jgi:hypothetical protein
MFIENMVENDTYDPEGVARIRINNSINIQYLQDYQGFEHL